MNRIGMSVSLQKIVRRQIYQLSQLVSYQAYLCFLEGTIKQKKLSNIMLSSSVIVGSEVKRKQ